MPLFSEGIVYHFACSVPGTQRVKKNCRDKAFLLPISSGICVPNYSSFSSGVDPKDKSMTPSDIPQAKLVYMLM